MSIAAPARGPATAGWLLGLVLASTAAAEPLTLNECTRLALDRNLNAEQARGDLQMAEADVLRSRSAFWPRITASGSWAKTEDPTVVFQGGVIPIVYPDEAWRLGARASLTLFDGLSNLNGYRQASNAREAAQDRYRGARQDVVTETERLFFEVRRQEALLDVQVQAVDLSAEQLKKTRAMKDLGAATQADVYKAEVDESNNRLSRLRTERDLEVAKASLASYLGLDPREPIELAPEEPSVAAELPLEEAIDRALAMNPELTASRSAHEASRYGVAAAKGDRLPSFVLMGSTNYSGFTLLGPSGYNDRHVENTIAVSMDFTLFDGFLTKSAIHNAEASLLKSRRAAESAERDVVLGVRTAWLDLEIARRSIDVAEGAVRSSEEDHRLAQERYRLGEGTILDVIDAQVNLTRSRTDLVSARYDGRIALTRLRSAIGDLAIPEPEPAE